MPSEQRHQFLLNRLRHGTAALVMQQPGAKDEWIQIAIKGPAALESAPGFRTGHGPVATSGHSGEGRKPEG